MRPDKSTDLLLIQESIEGGTLWGRNKGEGVKERWQETESKNDRGEKNKIARSVSFQIWKLHLASVDDQSSPASWWVQLREVLHPCFPFSSSYISIHSSEAAMGHGGAFESAPVMFSSSDLSESFRDLRSVETSHPFNLNPLNLITSRWNLNVLFTLGACSLDVLMQRNNKSEFVFHCKTRDQSHAEIIFVFVSVAVCISIWILK